MASDPTSTEFDFYLKNRQSFTVVAIATYAMSYNVVFFLKPFIIFCVNPSFDLSKKPRRITSAGLGFRTIEHSSNNKS